MNSVAPQRSLNLAKRHALLVLLFCYLPLFSTAPWWLFILLFVAVGYRLIADYYGSALLNKWIRLGVVILCLILLKKHYGSMLSNGYYIGFLLTFIGLKIIETQSYRDIKFLILCTYYLIFAALVVVQELWILLYLVIALSANLSLMLKLCAPEASLRQIGGTSIKQLLIAIPLSIILFYLFPRLASPLWQVPSLNQSTIGFSEKMTPGSLLELFGDDSTAMRITFTDKPILNAYWQGLILSFYNGVTWSAGWHTVNQFKALPELAPNQASTYQVILEPHQKKWLFYTGAPYAASPNLLYSPQFGLISQNKNMITERFSYDLLISKGSYFPLSPRQRALNTQLPYGLNPKLKLWAREEFARQKNDVPNFVHYLQQYIRQNPFWYTLTPPLINEEPNQMDIFWFQTQRGFCEHYASAVTVILRSAGIPAHVVVGYQGGAWNPIAQFLNIQQNDAHAWLEYWQDGVGWQKFDPTSFIAPDRIDKSILDFQEERLNQTEYLDFSGMSWWQKSGYYLESARFFSERWFLFYNQDTQKTLLEKVGLGNWDLSALIQASAGVFVLFILIFASYYQWQQRRNQDALLKEYHLLQEVFKNHKIPTPPSATLMEQCLALGNKKPELNTEIQSFLTRYELLRLKQNYGSWSTVKKELLALFKNFRKKIQP